MKNPSIMLRLIIIGYNETLKLSILNNVKEKVKCIGDDIDASWYSLQPYWKNEKQMEGIIALYSLHNISIQNVTLALKCNWQYISGKVHDISDSKKISYEHEEALWSKDIHESEICINENIVWLQIYKW